MRGAVPISVEQAGRAFTRWDALAVLLTLGLLVFLAEASRHLLQPLAELQRAPVSLDPHYLPEYAARTTLRMLVALVLSLAFTFTYATAAAKSKRAEVLLVPLLDILQSVPILGFISVTVVFFMSLAPGRVLGAEFAAIFAIFTSQAWNMAFSFYQSLRTVPVELVEASRTFRLSSWMHFWRVEVPFAMPQLIWNMMVSMSGSWFFVVASEAISVGNTTVTLPGIGSYIALAIEQKNLAAVGWAIGAMLVVILLYDQLLFRPLVAWADRFRFEQQAGVAPPQSLVLDVLRRSRIVATLVAPLARFWQRSYQLSRVQEAANPGAEPSRRGSRWRDFIWAGLVIAIAVFALWQVARFVAANISLPEAGRAAVFGLITLARVVVLIAIASVIWVPIGVMVGTRPRLAQLIQPVAQFLAAFPANVLFPVVVVAIVALQAQPQYLAQPADDPGHAVVHPVQRRGGRDGDPVGDARRRHQLAGARLAMVEEDRAAGGVSLLRHRRHYRLGRLVECKHRRRGRVMGRYAPARVRLGRLYCASDRGRRHAPCRARHRRDEYVRGHRQSPVLAAALLVRRTEIPARIRGQGHERCIAANSVVLPGVPEAGWRGSARPQRHQSHPEGRRNRRVARPFRIGQIDFAAADCRTGAADFGPRSIIAASRLPGPRPASPWCSRASRCFPG